MSDKSRRRFLQLAGGSTAIALAGCTGSDDESGDDDGMDDGGMENGSMDGGMENGSMEEEEMMGTDPEEAPRASIDRFSEAAGTLLVRNDGNGLPGPDEAIDFDQAPFLTQGLGPDGETVEYYNFDVQPTAPAPIYAFVYENGDPVEEQLNIVDVVPGDDGYNDFWQVTMVTVPDDYEANTVTSVSGISDADYDLEQTNVIKNCPIVPEGSTASKHAGDDHDEAPIVQGWYDGQVVDYFLFEEDSFETTTGSVPLSPIYVSFNTNPGQDGGGPAAGFMTEETSSQTHNVVATLPGNSGYSPLWRVNVYDNAEFGDVSDLDSATSATILDDEAAHVNCPIVSVA
ncbi:hypothetical protein [Halobacteriaceae bacterium SHR40]|uniref:hypothetical protein n=1 Tax=Halovenus amylolytica TaxID=2500550 RepID=UPI000FE31CE0